MIYIYISGEPFHSHMNIPQTDGIYTREKA